MNIFLTSIIGSITVGTIVSIVIWLVRVLQTRRDLTLALYQEFHSSDFYANVRAPAYKVTLKWNYLPTEVRDTYRNVVSSGWSHDRDSLTDRTRLFETPSSKSDIYKFHFIQPASEEYLTEHQALVALLRFWTRINMYRKNRCINIGLTRKLFSDDFGYPAPVFFELAEAVRLAIKNDQSEPSWIKDILELKIFFGNSK